MKVIKNGVILKDNKLINNCVLIFNDKIKDIISLDEYKKLENCDFLEYDAKGCYVLPGFIDQHIHGYGGYDVMDKSKDSIKEIKKLLVKNGVTSFLPTTLTASLDDLQEVCDIIKKIQKEDNVGTKIIGIHLEGPYINQKKKGAQNEKYIVNPNFDFIEKNIDVIKIVTLAPEINGNIELIKKYKNKINFQIGHTNASYNEAINGVNSGAKGFTHTFNAMSGIHHRDLGTVGACFLSEDTYAEIICDNIHLDSEVYNLVIKNKGCEKVIIITDCLSSGGLKDGEYTIGELEINLEDNVCRLEDGTLAGSVLKLNEGLKNVFKNTNESFVNCVKMVTENQAKYFNMQNSIGKLDVGFCSDIVIMDKEFKIHNTFVDGECEYEIQL